MTDPLHGHTVETLERSGMTVIECQVCHYAAHVDDAERFEKVDCKKRQHGAAITYPGP